MRWRAVMVACFLLHMLLPSGASDAVSQDTAATPTIGESPVPTMPPPPTDPPATLEPTAPPADPTTEPASPPAPNPTEVATEPGLPGIADGFSLLEGGSQVNLAPGQSHTLRIAYAVTTDRLSTSLTFWLAGDTVDGWYLGVEHPGVVSLDSVTAQVIDTAAISPDTVVEVAITVTAPTGAFPPVALHAASVASLPNDSEVLAVTDAGPLVAFSVLPSPADNDEDPRISPLVVSNNGMSCTQSAPHEVRPGTSISLSCTGPAPTVGSATYRATANTPGWLVSIGNGSPATTVSSSGGLLGSYAFTVHVHAPAGAAIGSVGNVLVDRTDVTGPTSTITVTTTTIVNQPGTVANRLLCSNANPANLTVAPGGSMTFHCVIEGLAGLDLAGLQLLGLQASVSSPSTWMLSSGFSGTGTGSISLDLASIANVQLLARNGFTITVGVPCVAANGNVTVNTSFTLLGLGLVTRSSTVPITVAGTPTQVAPASISATGVAAFPAAAWNGAGYPTTATSLTITFGSPVTGCMGNWQLLVSGTALARTGGGTIPIGSLSYTGATASTGISPGPPIPIGLTPVAIANGSASVTNGSTLNLNLVLAPPATAPVGTYGGSLTFTTALGPN